MDLSIFIKYYLDKDSDYQLSIDKIFLIKVQALIDSNCHSSTQLSIVSRYSHQ